MNTKQKIAILIGGLLILISGLFPTWTIRSGKMEGKNVRKILYANSMSVLLEAFDKKTEITTQMVAAADVSVDYSRMGVELIIIILLTAGAVIILSKKKPNLQRLIVELEAFVDKKVMDARSQASDPTAPSETRISEKAYAKGLGQMGSEIVERLKMLI